MIAGPMVDRSYNLRFWRILFYILSGYGPRKVMAGLLILGAIPSGLAGTAHTALGLYLVRFFIGILGGTFVTCQAWTTAFFDKNVVGTGNYMVSFLILLLNSFCSKRSCRWLG